MNSTVVCVVNIRAWRVGVRVTLATSSSLDGRPALEVFKEEVWPELRKKNSRLPKDPDKVKVSTANPNFVVKGREGYLFGEG